MELARTERVLIVRRDLIKDRGSVENRDFPHKEGSMEGDTHTLPVISNGLIYGIMELGISLSTRRNNCGEFIWRNRSIGIHYPQIETQIFMSYKGLKVRIENWSTVFCWRLKFKGCAHFMLKLIVTSF